MFCKLNQINNKVWCKKELSNNKNGKNSEVKLDDLKDLGQVPTIKDSGKCNFNYIFSRMRKKYLQK